MRKTILSVTAAVALALTLGACGAEDDTCDNEDARARESECGYYDATGGWIWYPWVEPNVGGRPPAGTRPTPPPGGATSRPAAVPPTPPAGRPPTTDARPPAPRPPAPVYTAPKRTTNRP